MRLDKYQNDVFKCGKRKWRNYHSFGKDYTFHDFINHNVHIENPQTNIKKEYGNSVVWRKIIISGTYGTELHIKLDK